VLWKTDLRARVRLCKSGDTLMGFASGRDGLIVYQRSPDGVWVGPETVKMETPASFYVPRFCPPNLGAVSYVPTSDPKTIKVLMVPNKFWKGQT
jgi:hypothetical protein